MTDTCPYCYADLELSIPHEDTCPQTAIDERDGLIEDLSNVVNKLLIGSGADYAHTVLRRLAAHHRREADRKHRNEED